MAPPPSSIPNYPPPPFFNRNNKLLLTAFTLIPIGAYIFLRSRETEGKNELLKVEEEGRKAWLQSRGPGGAEKGRVVGSEDGKNYGVEVGRSGGGV